MAEKGFGVKEINLIGASGTPSIDSPNNLNLNAVNVAISTNVSIGGTLTVTGNVSVGGTLTYEDVTNIDSVGIITARTGVKVLAGGINVVGVSYFNNNIVATATTALSVTAADESSDTSCNVLFSTAATGNVAPKTGTNLTFNSSNGTLTATTFSGSGASLTSLPAANLTGTLPAISGANLINLPAANLTGTLPAISGANLTGIAVTEAPVTDYTVTANGSSAYRFHGGGVDETEDDPDLHLVRGQKYRFNNTTGSSHPFALRVSSGGSAYTDGVTGSQNGIQFFTVPYDAPAKIVYQCTVHSGMVGNIYIRGGSYATLTGNVDIIGITTIRNASGTKLYEGVANGSKLFHAGGEKLSTELYGIDTHGTLGADQINCSGVGTFAGPVTVGYDTDYSPIQQSANTWFYTRADRANSVSGSNIQNLATGSIAISETIPISNMTRQSDAGAHSFYNSSSTSGSVTRDMSSGNPFHPKAHGLTMGTMFYAHTSGNNGSGVIHYGWTPTSHHFFVRYKYNSVGLNIGADTDGSDTWTTAYQNDLVSDSNWYFFVIAVERNGTLMTSLNGAPLTPIRMLGTAPTPTDARFGLAGDGYADNDSRHRYATAFWHKGVISNELIAQEYAWLKTIWTGASLP